MKVVNINKLLIVSLFILVACQILPAYGAVQLGKHMDIILSNDTIVRVFPEADSGSTRNPPVRLVTFTLDIVAYIPTYASF